MINISELCRVYFLNRVSVHKWLKEGTWIDELAKRGVAFQPRYTMEVLAYVNPARFDDLSKFPPNNIVESEKYWFRYCYSTPDGPIIDPRPRHNAPKGVYYDEKHRRWKARPVVKIPG